MKKFVFSLMLLLAATVSARGTTSNSTLIATGSADQIVSNEDQTEAPLLDRRCGTYYLGDTPLTRKEFRNFLEVNCPNAYDEYRKGNRIWYTGCIFCAASIACCPLCYIPVMKNNDWGGAFLMLGLSIPFAAFQSASVACMVVGGLKKFRAHDVYNESCRTKQQPQLELSLQTSQNGIGFALKF